jgi:ParB-like chromosome segregation protein Spo0J
MIEHQSLSISLAKLVRSPLNVRNGGRTHIDELARSILAQGVLQSLVVTKRDDKGKEAFEVVAGDRRLASLQLLRRQGKIKANFAVPCTLVPPANAIAASLTENVEREAMIGYAANQSCISRDFYWFSLRERRCFRSAQSTVNA